MTYEMTERAERMRKRRKTSPFPWLLGAAVLVAILAWMYGRTVQLPVMVPAVERWAATFATAAGAGVVLAGGIGAALYFGVVRRSGHRVGAAYALVLFAIATVASGMASMGAYGNRVGAMTLEQFRVRQMVEKKLNAAGHKYDAEVIASGLHAALSPGVLANDPKLTKAKAKIAKVRATVEGRRAAFEAVAAEARARLAAVDTDPELKRQVLADADAEQAAARARLERAWAADMAFLDEMEATADFLIRRRGAWRVEGDRYLFAGQADLDAFDAHMDKVSRAAEEARARGVELQAEGR